VGVIRKNIIWLLVSQVASWLITFVVLIVVPDQLGTDEFGAFSFAQGYISFFALGANLGTAVFISRAVARDHSLVGSYVVNGAILAFTLVMSASVVALGLGLALGYERETLLLIAILCAGLVPQIVSAPFHGGLGGMEIIARPARWAAIQAWVAGAVGVLVVWLGWGVVAYAVVQSVSFVIIFVALLVMIWPYIRGHFHFDSRVFRLLFRGGLPLLALSALTLIYGTIDVPILHSISGNDAVAWYTVAYRWIGIPIFIATAVVNAYFPSFSAHGGTLTPEFSRLVNRAVKLVAFVSLPAAVGTVMVADDLIHVFYEPDYDNSIVLVRILAAHVPIAAVTTILATALVAASRLRRYIIFAVSAAVLNPLACIVTINLAQQWWDNGAIGAAVVTAATEIAILVGAMSVRLPGVMDRKTITTCLRMTAAALTMVPVLLVFGDLPLLLQMVVGAACFAVGTFIFRVLRPTDVRAFVADARSRLGRQAPVET
jgi:O-antigen/teichoic acid export membrane protein